MRALTRLLMGTGSLFGRLASFCRARALFPNNPDVVCHWTTEVKYPQNVTLGRKVVIGSRCTIGAAAPVILGDHVRLSKGVTIETAGLDFSGSAPYPHVFAPVTLEDEVWVGTGGTILGGVTIGRGAVIAAGALVTKDIPAGCVAGGIPARVIG